MSVVCLGVLLATGAAGQGVPAAKEETVTGTVESVHQDGLEGCELCDACSDCAATHVSLRTRSRRIEVHLAPAWFLDALELAPTIGEELTVTGARVRLPKARGLAAREVRLRNIVFRLRDEHGLPLWRRSLTNDESGQY
jgi:hypothetical protein